MCILLKSTETDKSSTEGKEIHPASDEESASDKAYEPDLRPWLVMLDAGEG